MVCEDERWWSVCTISVNCVKDDEVKCMLAGWTVCKMMKMKWREREKKKMNEGIIVNLQLLLTKVSVRFSPQITWGLCGDFLMLGGNLHPAQTIGGKVKFALF